jgi:4-hydroxy-2-oxoheptanedioate aldolase
LQTNLTKAKLKAGETVFGCFVRYPDASLIEMLGYQGWDFIVFDAEHGTIEPRDCEHMVRAAELRGITPIIRVTTNQPPVILRYMDTGAQGLQVPLVNSAAEAEAAVRAVKYNPHGARGLAGVRAANFGQTNSFAEYIEQANLETLVTVQVESSTAVDQLSEIVAVDGLDVIFVGPTDLSHSLGVPGQPDHPTMLKAKDQIVEVVTQSNIALGMMVGNAQAAHYWRERGVRYITITLETLLSSAMRNYLSAVKT